MNTQQQNAIRNALEKTLGCAAFHDDFFHYDIYADYRDEMDGSTALEILTSDDPDLFFNQKMSEWYDEEEWNREQELEKDIAKSLDTSLFPDGLDEEALHNYIVDSVCFEYPFDHYYDQKFNVNIMVDTGDGNNDFVLNSVYPSYCGDYEDRIDSKAAIVWLAKTQGYSKTQLWHAMQKEELCNGSKFLNSMREEVLNISSHMNVLTFLVQMTLRQLIDLNNILKMKENIAVSKLAQNYLILDKASAVGLYDPWNGGGSILNIELEKEVRLPFTKIRSALPDGGDGYAVQSVYGNDSLWTSSISVLHTTH